MNTQNFKVYLSERCPTCGAFRGSWCRNVKSGAKLKLLHVTRQHAYSVKKGTVRTK